MKELTREDWMQNPTPRMMWVWGEDETRKKKKKVIYFLEHGDVSYPVVALDEDGIGISVYMYCAEITKTRRMTNKELSRWLRENPTRECKRLDDSNSSFVYSIHTYLESNANKEVDNDMRIRENDGEWREPFVEA